MQRRIVAALMPGAAFRGTNRYFNPVVLLSCLLVDSRQHLVSSSAAPGTKTMILRDRDESTRRQRGATVKNSKFLEEDHGFLRGQIFFYSAMSVAATNSSFPSREDYVFFEAADFRVR